MKGTIKDLLKITGVQGYVTAGQKGVQIKLPSQHRLAGSKDRFKLLYDELMRSGKKPGSIVEAIWDDIVLTVFISGSAMLMVLSNPRVNLAMVRMTGKLVMANLAKEIR